MKSQKIFVIVISDTPFKNTPDFTHWCKLVGFVFRQVVKWFLLAIGFSSYGVVGTSTTLLKWPFILLCTGS